jgi:hypothetical protein
MFVKEGSTVIPAYLWQFKHEQEGTSGAKALT